MTGLEPATSGLTGRCSEIVSAEFEAGYGLSEACLCRESAALFASSCAQMLWTL